MRPRVDPLKLIAALAAGGISLAAMNVALAQTSAAAKQPAPEESAAAKIAAAKAKTGYAGKTVPGSGPRGKGPVGRTKVMPLADDGKGPDVAALRYYVSQGQKARVEIEIKRLQTLYPNWQVPNSIYDTRAAGAVDEQPFWDLFAAGAMDRLRVEIAKRMREEPGWKPSDDLSDKIRRKQLRVQITKLWKAGKWKDLLSFVKAEGFGGDDADVDIMWTVAEAYAKTKQTDSALKIYKSVLGANSNPEQRLATVQKAMATLRMVDVEQLIALTKSDASGQSELAPIATDITRARISAFLHDERTEPVPEDEVEAFKEYARKVRDPNQSGLVAWYNYKRKAFPEALEWFKFSIGRGGDTMIAHGLAHTLRELKLKRDTEEVSYAWREPLVNNAILFIDILERDLTKKIPPYIDPQRLLRYAQVTKDSAAGEGAQGLAWYAYNTCQFEVALKWFRHAVAWHPKEGTVYGLAVTLRRLKKMGEFWDLLNRYDGLFPKVIEIIFPDDYIHPPTPCDVTERMLARMRADYMRKNNGAQPRFYTPDQAAMPGQYAANPLAAANPALAANLYQQSGNGLTPPWRAPYATGMKNLPLRKNIREPIIDRSLFPVSVDTQNPLRRWPTGRLTGTPAEAASVVRGRLAGLANEPPLRMDNLVARRVPGVGPMPYERWGYALLPSYKGGRAASAPHQALTAPKGTLWTTLHAKDALDTIEDDERFFDPTTALGLRNLELALAAIKRVPRVPSPEESRTGPWSSPKPYKSEKQLEAEKGLTSTIGDVVNSQPESNSVIRANLTNAAIANSSAPGPSDNIGQLIRNLPRPPGKPQANAPAGSKPVAKPVAAEQPRRSGKPVSRQSAPVKKTERNQKSSAAGQLLPPMNLLAARSMAIQPPAPPESSGLKLETGARDELGRSATRLYNDKRYAEALAALNKRAVHYPETTKLRLVRAWALLNLRRVDEARQIFASLGPGNMVSGARVKSR